jgi:hypothetical protein
MENNINISLDKTTGASCDECNNISFIEGFILRKASRFLTGTTQDAIIPVNVFICSKCAHVNEEFLPISLKEANISKV